MPVPNRAYRYGINDKDRLVPSEYFGGELACPTCDMAYTGPYEGQFDRWDLRGVSGFCRTCGHPYWDEE